MAGEILYCVLCTTKQNNPFIEGVFEEKAIADFYCKVNQDNGIFSVVVEKKLNRLPEKAAKMQNRPTGKR